MPLPTPSTPPVTKGLLGAIGNEWGKFASTYANATKAVQNYGARIRSNVIQGQKDFNSGKSPYYGTTNIFKKSSTKK